MATLTRALLSAAVLQMVSCGNAWYYQTTTSNQPNRQLVKQQFLLPPYPSYQHELLVQPPPPPISVHDNRYYGTPGEFAEPSSYNELSFEGPYEVTQPRIPGLYFRLSSGVFVPVKAVYSFPPFLERIIQRIQGYYSVYNPPDTLTLDRPLAGGVPQPGLDLLPVLPPYPPAVLPPVKPGEEVPPTSTPAVTTSTAKPEGGPVNDDEVTTVTSTTTESTKEETTSPAETTSSPESFEITTEPSVEETTNA